MQVAGIAVALGLAVIAAVPSHVVLTVDPVEGETGVISGWIRTSGEGRVSLEEQAIPWETRLSGRSLRGFIEAGRDGRVRVRARLFRGPVALSELNVVGARIALVNEAGVFSGSTR